MLLFNKIAHVLMGTTGKWLRWGVVLLVRRRRSLDFNGTYKCVARLPLKWGRFGVALVINSRFTVIYRLITVNAVLWS